MPKEFIEYRRAGALEKLWESVVLSGLSKKKNFYHEPHEHHELFAHILSLFVLVRVVRGKIKTY